MLQHLSIRNLVLIEQASLTFAPGLVALTGETGAGKSILLDGLGLVLGERADLGLIRHGAAEARVTAEFLLAEDHPACAFLRDRDLPAGEEGAITIRRTLKPDGGSRAMVNDTPVAVATLRQLGELLVEIHGQGSERGLLNEARHRDSLDDFGGLGDLVAAMAAAWRAARAATAARQQAETRAADAARDRDFLEHAVAELERLRPIPGEEEQLATERGNMQKGLRLGTGLREAETLVAASDGALAKLRLAARRLERIRGEDADLGAAVDAIDRALVAGDDIERLLGAASARFEVAPERLDAIEVRLFDLRAAARKHRVAVDALPELAGQLAARLAAIASGADELALLREQEARAAAEAARAAAALSAARRAAAARLDRAVAAELPPLHLGEAQFRTTVEAADTANPAEKGADRVRFEVRTNKGGAFGPLAKIASGGEMSRFALALKVVLAGKSDVDTMIFDEIDHGMGGATASAIGARLAAVASRGQVLVVTHSPQVAAMADQHVLVAKSGGETAARLLQPAERRTEIARMLSGATITEEALAQAGRLLGARAAPAS